MKTLSYVFNNPDLTKRSFFGGANSRLEAAREFGEFANDPVAVRGFLRRHDPSHVSAVLSGDLSGYNERTAEALGYSDPIVQMNEQFKADRTARKKHPSRHSMLSDRYDSVKSPLGRLATIMEDDPAYLRRAQFMHSLLGSGGGAALGALGGYLSPSRREDEEEEEFRRRRMNRAITLGGVGLIGGGLTGHIFTDRLPLMAATKPQDDSGSGEN